MIHEETGDKYLDAKLQLEIAIENLNENIKSCNELGLNVRIMQMPTGAAPIGNPAPCMPMPVVPGWGGGTIPMQPSLESAQFSLQKLYKEF